MNLIHGNIRDWWDFGKQDSQVFNKSHELAFHVPPVRQWTDVSCLKHPELQVVLLEGKEKVETPTQTILPLPSHRTLSHKR